MHTASTLLCLAGIAALASSSALPRRNVLKRSTVEPYAPYTTSCPGELIRVANSLSKEEKEYAEKRQHKASKALHAWLAETWGCEYVEEWDMPKLAIALSGGGPKAGLTTAGFVYGVDGRDSQTSVSGLLQASTYISALSGGTLTLSGVMANDFERVSVLKSLLYNANYQNPFLAAIQNEPSIADDINNKTAAGYPATLADIYGRSIALDFIQGPPAGGDAYLWSNVTLQSSFQQYDAPFPLLTVSNTDVAAGMCFPNMSGPVWEVSPTEFGSWDSAVNAFTPTKYMGTSLVNGKPSSDSSCTVNFDNTGFLTGISSNILLNQGSNCTTGNYSSNQLNSLASIVNSAISTEALVNPYAIVPNPFYQSTQAGAISSEQDLFMLDGGDTGQGIPIFPWLQPEREVDVIFVVDTTSDATTNITNGGSVYNTYLSAQMKGISKMPIVPTMDQFKAQKLYSRAQFYGCHDDSVATLIYYPNTNETTLPGSTFFFTPENINAVYYGGEGMATQFGAEDWPGCLACGIMHKKDWKLPDECEQCLDKYCWKP